MKIMFYNDDISVSSGGAERVITNLATRFADIGYDCVMLNHVRGKVEYPLSDKVRRLIMRPQGSRSGLLKKYDIVAGIRRAVKKERPDVLVTFGIGLINRALFATVGLSVKNVISYRNSAFCDLKSLKNRLISRTLHLRANGVVFQTKDAMNAYPRRLQKIGAIIHNQVAPVFFDTHYDGNRQNIVSVGRLKKNQQMLINAFSMITDNVSDNLLLYGDGPDRDNLQNQINRLGLTERVCLKGTVENIPDAIKSARLFVLPSVHEGFPNAMIEAMALGLPCVSTDCKGGGARELLSGDLERWLVPINDTKSMSEKMLVLLQDEELRESVAHECRQRAEGFRPDAIFEQWRSFIEGIVR